jgi:hypothetical protein
VKTIRLVWDAELGKHVLKEGARAFRRGQFIPPIPAEWFNAAGRLPGKALIVAGVIRFEAAKRHSTQVKLTGRMTESFGIRPTTRHRALAALAAAGLIRIERRFGPSPMIRIIERE